MFWMNNNTEDSEELILDETQEVYQEKYEALSLEKEIERRERAQKAAKTKLARYFVEPR